jgi:hypothetical protein
MQIFIQENFQETLWQAFLFSGTFAAELLRCRKSPFHEETDQTISFSQVTTWIQVCENEHTQTCDSLGLRSGPDPQALLSSVHNSVNIIGAELRLEANFEAPEALREYIDSTKAASSFSSNNRRCNHLDQANPTEVSLGGCTVYSSRRYRRNAFQHPDRGQIIQQSARQK